MSAPGHGSGVRISPNSRIPGIVDHDPQGGGPPVSMFESGAILLYLARKTGNLIPSDLRGEVDTLQWLIWQPAGLEINTQPSVSEELRAMLFAQTVANVGQATAK